MFADPFRKVIWVSCIEGDLRIAVAAAQQAETPEADLRWLAYQRGKWVDSYRPGVEPQTQPASAPATEPATADTQGDTEPATEPAVTATTAPATEPAPATQPAAASTQPAGVLPIDPRLLPIGESWWTRPSTHATVVYHYVPLGPTYGVTHGFVVPGFEFDDDHSAVDNKKGELYLIHDGVLFSLAIPENAR